MGYALFSSSPNNIGDCCHRLRTATEESRQAPDRHQLRDRIPRGACVRAGSRPGAQDRRDRQETLRDQADRGGEEAATGQGPAAAAEVGTATASLHSASGGEHFGGLTRRQHHQRHHQRPAGSGAAAGGSKARRAHGTGDRRRPVVSAAGVPGGGATQRGDGDGDPEVPDRGRWQGGREQGGDFERLPAAGRGGEAGIEPVPVQGGDGGRQARDLVGEAAVRVEARIARASKQKLNHSSTLIRS